MTTTILISDELWAVSELEAIAGSEKIKQLLDDYAADRNLRIDASFKQKN